MKNDKAKVLVKNYIDNIINCKRVDFYSTVEAVRKVINDDRYIWKRIKVNKFDCKIVTES